LDNFITDTALELQNEWQLFPEAFKPVASETISEATILQKLELRVLQLIAQGPDSFFQLMYRLDVSEKKLAEVMHDEKAGAKIAELIYRRQLEKITSRAFNKCNASTEEDAAMKW
jgi:hypothetical protein